MDHKMLARYPVGNPRRKWRQDNFILALASPGAMTLDAPSELVRKKTRRGVKTALDSGGSPYIHENRRLYCAVNCFKFATTGFAFLF